jgi:hypothetical protein
VNIAASFARAALVLLVGVAPALAQTPNPTAPAKALPTPDSLAGITRRGVALAQYDVVAWRATDAVMALHPAEGELNAYVARRIDSTWSVAFGHLSAAKDTFWVAFEARQLATKRDSFVVSRRVVADTGYYARAARALDVARFDFGKTTRPYNAAVIPAENGEWFVYFVPAQARADVFPLGGDVRYRVSADGRTVRAARQLHTAVIEFGPSSVRQMGSLAAGMHTAVLDDYPEDTDVFHVLVRTPQVPEYIVSDAFVFTIAPNGAIRCAGRRWDILGK